MAGQTDETAVGAQEDVEAPLPKAQKQTTLPATSTKVQRRVSAPMRLDLAPSKPENATKSGVDKPKGKGTEKQPRKSCSSRKGFDWKGWSAK